MKFYECGARYPKMMDNGLEKKVTEVYAVNALSFSEAEDELLSEMAQYTNEHIDVVSMKIAPYKELVEWPECTEDNRWYRAKVKFITIDERTEREKKAYSHYLVQAKDIDHARHRLDGFMRDSLVDWECEAIQETKIIDVFNVTPRH